MPTKPRGFFTMDERDSVIYDTAERVAEISKKINDMHVCLLGMGDSDDRGLCGDLRDLKEDHSTFKRDVVKVGVGLVISVCLALLGVVLNRVSLG